MRTHNMSVTYAPKIYKVRAGTCTQTIRVNRTRPKRVGDLLRIYTWTGKPYRSKRELLCTGVITELIDVTIYPDGLFFVRSAAVKYWYELDDLAKQDGIDPPTGVELGRVLSRINRIPVDGVGGQIIKWECDNRDNNRQA